MTMPRPVVRAWLALMALSAAMAVLADLRSGTSLGAPMILGLGIVILLKAYVILADYMSLRAHPGVLAGFVGALGAVLAVVCGAFVLIRV